MTPHLEIARCCHLEMLQDIQRFLTTVAVVATAAVVVVVAAFSASWNSRERVTSILNYCFPSST